MYQIARSSAHAYVMFALVVTACSPAGDTAMSEDRVGRFAAGYTAAWNSKIPENVAAYYAADGWLAINGGEANVGREALAGVAGSFMSAFPDMVLEFEGLEFVNGRVKYHWTFTGTNTGPDGTGNAVHFSGFESWVFDDDGLIAESLGNFDQAEYEHQLAHGVDAE